MKMKILHMIFLLSMAVMLSWCSASQPNAPRLPAPVLHVGAMRNVMWKGELAGVINLDTIAHKKKAYGIGPSEFLNGELIIIDGQSFKSTVTGNGSMHVEKTFDAKAPFFVYTYVNKWKEVVLPDSVTTLKEIENYLNSIPKLTNEPFVFKLEGMIDRAEIHVVNLPKGREVKSPEQAHEGKTNFAVNGQDAEIVGFYSTKHQGVFTHHDSFVHMHLITRDKNIMGHVDNLTIRKANVRLFLAD
jgi:acetolactate decarboxylase